MLELRAIGIKVGYGKELWQIAQHRQEMVYRYNKVMS